VCVCLSHVLAGTAEKARIAAGACPTAPHTRAHTHSHTYTYTGTQVHRERDRQTDRTFGCECSVCALGLTGTRTSPRAAGRAAAATNALRASTDAIVT
jgi:hypothetical protein